MAYTWGHNPEVSKASYFDGLRRWNSPEQEEASRRGDKIQPSEEYVCKMCDGVFEVRNQKDINNHLKSCKKSMEENLRVKIKAEMEAEQAKVLPSIIREMVAKELEKEKRKGKRRGGGNKKE